MVTSFKHNNDVTEGETRTVDLTNVCRCLNIALNDILTPIILLIAISALTDPTRVKSGILGQTARFGKQPYLFHISNIGIN